MLRALREARGVTQDGWAALLGVGRTTVQRWERGEGVPDAHAEAALIALCRDKGLLRSYDAGVFAGIDVTAAWLADALASARLSLENDPAPPPVLEHRGNRPHNVPIQPTPLIAREHEIGAVHDLLARDDVRLVTLTGPGGTGKTRLSLHIAAQLVEQIDRFADGVFFVPLAPISDPQLAPAAIAQALEIRAVGGHPIMDSLKDYLRHRSILLVLDNFEQILAAASVVSELLGTSHGLKILVTSRAPLELRGEHELMVPPLALPDLKHLPAIEALAQYAAVALFIERARAIRSDFVVTNDNATAVAEICIRLDGLPLAIELAAARSRLLSPQAMLARLERRLPLLSGGPSDLPARQRTLRDTIAWSYDLLNEDERRLFCRLSVFVGGWTLEAAERVGSMQRAVGSGDETGIAPAATAYCLPRTGLLDGLESLVAKSLIRCGDDPDGEPRFMMLETIREFGLEQLAATGEETSVRRRHLGWFADFAERCQPRVFGPEGPAWVDRMAAELDNLRAAMAWSMSDPSVVSARAGLRIAGAAHQLWLYRDNLAEGQHWLELTLAADEARSPDTGQEAPLPAARLGAQGAHPRVIALNSLSICCRQRGRAAEGAIPAGRALVLARTVLDRRGEAGALIHLGMLAFDQGDLDRADSLFEESRSIARELDDLFILWPALYQRGDRLRRLGQHARARPMLEEALAVARTWGNAWNSAMSLTGLAQLALAEGNLDQATTLTEESLVLWTRIGDARSYRTSIWQLGEIALANDDPRRAAERFTESLNLSLQASSRGEIARCLDGIVAAGEMADHIEPSGQRSTKGAHLLGTAAALREVDGAPVATIPERALSERVTTMVQTSLGGDAYAVEFAAGRVMPAEQAIELALALAAEIQASSS